MWQWHQTPLCASMETANLHLLSSAKNAERVRNKPTPQILHKQRVHPQQRIAMAPAMHNMRVSFAEPCTLPNAKLLTCATCYTRKPENNTVRCVYCRAVTYCNGQCRSHHAKTHAAACVKESQRQRRRSETEVFAKDDTASLTLPCAHCKRGIRLHNLVMCHRCRRVGFCSSACRQASILSKTAHICHELKENTTPRLLEDTSARLILPDDDDFIHGSKA